ncbi:peptide/nickel transport system permease protein [Evansella vedderi]|uniref:Peptide/nickel transport system permease protein n=1 Tax=Evansella vedderi TaxID=38282 RepID=A0ABU0A0V6_9BACI|nr:ABC transporter permease [Evansella vedderi]MDQ0257116.1 peptide/nickel transport system permease protein [Evansella vedderi]
MGAFIIKRLFQTIAVLFFVTLIVFMIIQILPGDPAQTMLGADASQEQIQKLREELGLNDPFIVQYFNWAAGVIGGDLGHSIFYKETVINLMSSRFPITLTIGISALIVTVIIGIPLGVIAAVNRGGAIDSVVVVLSNIGIATPNFWLGILGVYFLSLKLGWLPVQGYVSPFTDPIGGLKTIIMPVLVLAATTIASVMRQTRSAMLEVIHQDFIRTARSKGLKERFVIIKHGLRNALIPVITLLGLQLGNIIGGTVLIEQVFNIPGMGSLLVSSVFMKDFIVVQACVLVIAVLVVFANLFVDLAYRLIDPRIKYN